MPWQSRLLLQPATHTWAWQMKAFTQSSLLAQPASGAGAPQVELRQASAPGHSERCAHDAPLEPELPLVPLLPLLAPLVEIVPLDSAQSPDESQTRFDGHCKGRTPRQLPQRPLMQNKSFEPQSLDVAHTLVPLVLPPPESCEPVVCVELCVPPQATNQKLTPTAINARRMWSSTAPTPQCSGLLHPACDGIEAGSMRGASSIQAACMTPTRQLV